MNGCQSDYCRIPHATPRPGVASCSVWSDSIMFRDVPICKIDKILFADSENQGPKRYFMKM